MDLVKSSDLATELVKQIITLSTGMIAITVTFLKDVVGTKHVRRGWAMLLLQFAWIGFLAAIIFGLLTLGAIIGDWSSPTPLGVYQSSARYFALMQWLAFLWGVCGVLSFGWITLNARFREAETSEPTRIQERPDAAETAVSALGAAMKSAVATSNASPSPEPLLRVNTP
jgi:hypothetical protein